MKRIFVWLVICVFLFADNLYAGPYTSSAHGDSAYGVSRRSTSQYARGHCAHCHEQHASIDGDEPNPVGGGPSASALFYTNHISQIDNFCFQCHDNTTLISSTAIINHSYSYRAGGWTGDTLTNILDAFTFSQSYGSSHNLNDIKTFISGKWGYTTDSNPCCGCHNPHAVQGDPANLAYTAKNVSPRGYPVSRPSQHENLSTWGLWGDAAEEKMRYYTASYQAPYRYGSTTAYEPDGSATVDGSNLTNYVTFCLDCHNYDLPPNSTTLGRLTRIDWSSSGDVHGQRDRRHDCRNKQIVKPPYANADLNKNYVLACTDCHEPHGSGSYCYLIREEVNGEATDVTENTDAKWKTLCQRCHYKDHNKGDHHDSCIDCHRHGGKF